MSDTWPDVRGPKFGQMSVSYSLFFYVRVCTSHSGRMSGLAQPLTFQWPYFHYHYIYISF